MRTHINYRVDSSSRTSQEISITNRILTEGAQTKTKHENLKNNIKNHIITD